MALNPNYPVVEELWGPSWTAAGASFPASRMVNFVDRTLSQANARRGKQYELDQPQAGEYSVVLDSRDGALDPTNTGGPYGGKILPYQPYRRRAQWPPTANLLAPEIATAGEGFAAGAFPASWNFQLPTGAIPGTVAVLGNGQAWQGANVFSFAIPNAQGVNSGIFKYDVPAIRPGKQVTFSLWVANTTASTSTTVLPYIAWLNADGSQVFGNGSSTAITGASGTPAWQRLTVTATAPTTGAVYGMRIGFNVGATTTAASTIIVDGLQVEWASTATTWVSPGKWYPIFSGFTERWATQWANDGTYEEVTPTAVDAFALLSQVQLKEVFQEEIDSHSPRFCYPLGDAVGSTSFADESGNFRALPAVLSKTGNGNLSAGNSVTSASATGAFTGSTGTVVTLAPPIPGSGTNPNPATVLDLTAVGINGPGNPAGWTRMVAFRATSLPSDRLVIWETRTDDFGDGTFDGHIRVALGSDGWLRVNANANLTDYNFSLAFQSGVNVADGNWHLFMFGFDASHFRTSLDGVQSTSTGSGLVMTNPPVDCLGALWVPRTKTATDVYKGDLAFVTEFPTLLSEADMGQLYSTWKSSASGESSSARYSRILRYAGYTGASNIGTGLTASMGPADSLSGGDAMSALSDVVTTENGEHFVSADGTITFLGRGVRYNALTPALTFGDGTGELPYEDLQLDFDSTHLSNSATVTQQPTGNNFTASDAASIAAYYTRTLTRTINTTSAFEAQDAANYFVSRYKQPLTRVQSIKLHPSANTALWAPLLALELGTRVRINRRPFGAPMVSIDCFVEQISWDMNADNEAYVTLQCSPIDANPYGQFAPWHTTLNTPASIGVTSIIVNASADNTNPLSAQLPAGTQLILGLGTANQETVTVAGISGTSSGWTTALVGLTVATTKAHSVGDIICEVLPSGVTDPTYLDSAEKFGTALFAY
jgi:hypothetical protein